MKLNKCCLINLAWITICLKEEEDKRLTNKDIERLLDNSAHYNFFKSCIKIYDNPKIIANWILNELTMYLKQNKTTFKDTKIKPEDFIEILKKIDSNEINRNVAKCLLKELIGEKK